MDNETKEKLTELKHQHDMLETKMNADMKVLQAERKESKAENETSIGALRTDIERLRTTIEGNARTLLLEIAAVVGVGVAITSLIVGLIVS